jgi:hypothetical protein
LLKLSNLLIIVDLKVLISIKKALKALNLSVFIKKALIANKSNKDYKNCYKYLRYNNNIL